VTLVDNEAVENPVWPPRAVGTPTGVACARAIEQELGTNDKEHDVDEILIISPVLSNSLSFNFRLKLVALVKTIVVSYGANAETKDKEDRTLKGPSGQKVYSSPKGGKYYFDVNGNKKYLKRDVQK